LGLGRGDRRLRLLYRQRQVGAIQFHQQVAAGDLVPRLDRHPDDGAAGGEAQIAPPGRLDHRLGDHLALSIPRDRRHIRLC